MADEAVQLHPVIMASDITDGQSGIYSRMEDAISKGIPAAAISGAMSIYNTFLDYQGKEAESVSKAVRDYDQNIGSYYEDNKETIDLAGMVGTSFVPGMLGVKALKLAQSGETVGAFGRALGYAGSKKNQYFEQAMAELAKSGGTVTSAVSQAKRAQLSWALADQTLTNAAFELAVVATMNDSPVFEDADFGDFTKNVAIGALFGGAIGGAIESIGTRGILKRAQSAIEGNRRLFDTVFDPVKMGLSKADETLIFAENIVKLPDDFFATNFTFRKDGKMVTRVLDTSEAFKNIKTRAEKVAIDSLAIKFNELAGGGEITGKATFEFILKKIADGKASGHSADTIVDTVQGYLQGVKKVTNLTEDSAAATAPKQFFINEKPTGLADLFSEVRGPNTGKQAYYLVTGDPSKIKTGSLARMGFDSIDDAFDAGYDVVFNKSGHVSINPKSTVISKTPDQALNNKFFLDLETGGLTQDVKVVGADLLKTADDFKHADDSVKLGKKWYKQEASKATNLADSPLTTSARFMWASELKDSAFTNRVIDATDFALLDRAAKLPAKFRDSDLVQIKHADGREIPLSEIVDLPRYINELKLQYLRDTLGKEIKSYDIRDLSNALNVSRTWIEDAITSNFAVSKQLLEETRDLSAYFKPQTVQMEWDTAARQLINSADGAAAGPNHLSTAMLGHHYTLMTRERELQNAFGSVFGEEAERFLDTPKDLILQVTERGAGAKTFTASNADYGRQAELYVQDIGKQSTLVMQKWRDEAIGALAPYINAVRDSLEASAELGVLTTALRRDVRKYYLDVAEEEVEGTLKRTYRLVDREAVKMVESGKVDDLDDAIQYLQAQSTAQLRIRGEYQITHGSVGDFLEASTAVNGIRVNKQTTLLNAMGVGRELDARVVYSPPVDTRRYPYFAHVIAKERIGAATDIAMITAKSEDELRQLAARVGDDYEVIFKNDTKKRFKALGIYDYDMQINESTINSALQKKGILGDHFPETRGQNVLEDYVRWHANSSDNLVRTGVQAKYRQFFSELNFLSEQFQSASTSAAVGLGIIRKNIADPFQDYVKTALALSKQSEYPLIDSLNEFVDKIGTRMYTELDNLQASIRSSKGKDLVSLQKANELIEQAGLGTPYKTMEEYLLANTKFPKNLIKTSFQKVNLWLATAVLRFDFANSIINTISTPILLGTEVASIRGLIKNDPQLAGKLAELTTVVVPGQTQAVPSTTKLIGKAIENFFGADKATLLARYEKNGDIKKVLQLYHEVLDDLSYQELRTPSAWVQKVEGAVEKGATITGNNFSEQFTRFVSADVMRQITQPLVDAGKMVVKEQDAYISSFVNRVQGNYTSSQRPIVFQGTTGAAVGLFQTYAFNVLQQLFRHVENRDVRAALTFAGLQSSVYGMNGLPFFDAINQHIIGNAAGNKDHTDAYSALPRANKELGNWMLYGTASAFPLFGNKGPALYSRGDINPRHLSILPINPLDVPAVSASIKLVGSVLGFAKQASNGADLSNSFLQALEHHGWNRPLAGFAQVLAGQTTTGKGSLISAANDLETTSFLARIPERMIYFGGIPRVMGSRPMDEAVALHNLYRNKAYEATDRARIEALGQVVKTKLAGNKMPEEDELEDFMADYAKSGGRIETFSSSMQRWSKDANVSIVNQMAKKLTNSSGRKLQSLMGGEELQDYSTLAETPQE